jgi:uncharacterized RDD family membrane protein YckC
LRLDTLRSRSTPEGVELALRIAGAHARCLAWLLDAMLQVAVCWSLAIGLFVIGKTGQGLYLLGLFIVTWGYPVACEVFLQGATLGKKALQLKVVHVDGTPVGLPASLIRNLVRFADFFPFFYGAGLLSCLLTDDSRRLGDLAAGTVVVHREGSTLGRSVPDTRPIAPPVPLELPEQRALIGYGERAAGWTPERRLELAQLLQPLTRLTGPWAVERLLAHAAWLVGRR